MGPLERVCVLHIFAICAPLQILGAVVLLVAVDVVDTRLVVGVGHPRRGDDAVDERFGALCTGGLKVAAAGARAADGAPARPYDAPVGVYGVRAECAGEHGTLRTFCILRGTGAYTTRYECRLLLGRCTTRAACALQG